MKLLEVAPRGISIQDLERLVTRIEQLVEPHEVLVGQGGSAQVKINVGLDDADESALLAKVVRLKIEKEFPELLPKFSEWDNGSSVSVLMNRDQFMKWMDTDRSNKVNEEAEQLHDATIEELDEVLQKSVHDVWLEP